MLKSRVFANKSNIIRFLILVTTVYCLSIGIGFAFEFPAVKGKVNYSISEANSFYKIENYEPVPIYGGRKNSTKTTDYQKLFDKKLTEQILESHTLIGTYYSLKNNLTATLMLNNKGGLPLIVTPTIYSKNGTQLELSPLTIDAASYSEFDLRELLANAEEEFQEGSLRVTYQGKSMELGSQVKLIDSSKSLIWEEQFFESAMKHISNRLESVWWLPVNNCETKFVISNTTDIPVTATIKVDGTSPGQQSPVEIQLNPHETRVLDVIRDLVRKNNGTLHRTGGISITHSGSPGAVLARMLISQPNKGFSSTMNFIDPEMTDSKKWYGAGLHLGKINKEKLQQILVARNVGNKVTTISGRIPYTKLNGRVAVISIPQIQISPNSIETINLQDLISSADVPASIEYASIEVEFTTPKGSVITSVLSVSQNNNQVFQVPMYDPLKTPSSAGGYPWKADGDYRTIVYIKNETNQSKRYSAFLNYEGGGYAIEIKQIKGHETVAIDFRKLRDEQVPDAMGRFIPLNIDKGQISWSINGNENHTLNGRSEQISLSQGIASTYDCRNCCPNNYYDSWLNPSAAIGYEGDVTDFDDFFRESNCYGQIYPFRQVDLPYWESLDPNVASCYYNSGVTTALSPGETIIQSSWTADSWFDDGGERCDYIPIDVLDQAYCDVLARPNVNIDNFDAVGKNPPNTNFSATIKVTVSNNPNNLPITLTLAPNSGTTGVANFVDTNGMTIGTTMSITQTTNVQIKGITESSTKDNMRLKATFNNNNNNQQLDDEDFTVISIELSLKYTNQVSNNNSKRGNYNTALGTYDLGGPFLSNGTAGTQWRIGIEIKGTVLPSNFSKKLVFDRELVSLTVYTRDNYAAMWNSSLICPNITPAQTAPCPDMSEALLIDDDPSEIYDLDAPGSYTDDSQAQVGRAIRRRYNFRQWVTISQKNGGNSVEPVRVSKDIDWFFRLSIIKTSPGVIVVLSDVPTDNQVGPGTTSLNLNL